MSTILRPLRLAAHAFARDRTMVVAFGLLGLLILVSVAAPLIVQHDPATIVPRLRLRPAHDDYWIGTDSLGRDLLARVLYGGRLSITLAVLVSMVAVFLRPAGRGWMAG